MLKIFYFRVRQLILIFCQTTRGSSVNENSLDFESQMYSFFNLPHHPKECMVAMVLLDIQILYEETEGPFPVKNESIQSHLVRYRLVLNEIVTII